MFYAIITATNDNLWETQRNNDITEVANTMGEISSKGVFIDKFGFFVYVNPVHILSIEITEE